MPVEIRYFDGGERVASGPMAPGKIGLGPVKEEHMLENFADGKGPGKPGDSVRHGIPKHATMAQLQKASHAPGRKGQLARWQLNMRRGRKRANESYVTGNIQYHNKLNPVAWHNNELDPKIQAQLLKTALFFTRSLDINNFQVIDVVLTGSMANYNYTQFSDFDVHVVTNYQDLQCDDLAAKFYAAKKKIWNTEHDITIHGHEVEMYVEDSASPAISGAVYSLLKGAWVKEPHAQDPAIDDAAVNAKTRDLIKQIDVVLSGADDPEDVIRIVHKLKQMRQSGLDRHGEFGVENLSFKILRNLGYIQRLHEAYLRQQDQQLSIR
jgi:predicted nucleotidyltransferase